MGRIKPQNHLSLQDQIAEVKAEIEELKLAKAQGVKPAVLDQNNMRYEDIQLHPDEQADRDALMEELRENARLRNEYNQREWYLKMIEHGP